MDRPLGTLQRWMQSVITHPGGVEHGIASDTAQDEIAVGTEQIEQVIRRSHAQSSIERLSVYANAYSARLLECLREEYSAVAYAVGEKGFDSLAIAFLHQYPSTSYTLADLGAKFPQHLAESRPPRETDEEEPNWIDFLIDLARLERLYGDVFDGPGIERLETLQLDDLLTIPPDRRQQVRFQTAPCLRLATFRFPVQDFASAVRNRDEDSTEEIPIPDACATRLAVSRIGYRVRRWSLSETEYRLLEKLTAGASLQEAIATAFVDSEKPDETIAANLREWFTEWSAAGFFIAVK